MNLGTRLKNWLNVRYSIHNQWRGQIGQERGFCEFHSVVDGLRAGRIILSGYLGRGINTPASMISRWAPPKENDTEGYIKFVCEQSGLDRNETLLIGDLNQMIRAMCKMETGNTPSDDQMIEAWKE